MDAASPSPDADAPPAYIDTPYGILTASGRWYHVTEADLREYAGQVFEHVSLETLLDWSDAWLQSARTLTLWALPVLLWLLPPLPAAASALGLYVGWKTFSPSVVHPVAVRLVRWLQPVVLQGLYYVLTLSLLAASGAQVATLVGLAAFLLFRFGAFRWAFRPALQPLERLLYPLPVPDQVLRGLIIRVALRHRLRLAQLDHMTREIIANWSTHRSDD
jgi:hypothetical protein